MNITVNDLSDIIYNPDQIQSVVLNNLATEGIVISDTTNPFLMLLEASATMPAASATESKNILRKMYPSLAEKDSDLYHHLSDDVLANMFAIPAEASIIFYVNVIDLRTVGYRPTGANYVETTIPVSTEVTILNTCLTVLNDIIVKLYDNGTVFVEQQQGEVDIAYENLGVLRSGVHNDTEGVAWIVFETLIKQVKKTTKTTTANATVGVAEVLPLTNKYYFSGVYFKNDATGGVYSKINNSHNEEYINPDEPSVYINLTSTSVTYKIPDVYLVSDMISGSLKIEMYETLGKVYFPIDKYEFSEFTIKLGETTKSESSATSPNIAILCNSRQVLEGGVDPLSAAELKKAIIYNTTGDIDLPITEYQISRMGEMSGFNVTKVLDVVTERLYVASKNLPDLVSDLIYAKQDVFFNTVNLVISDIIDYESVTVTNNSILIKSGSVFKEDNGIVTLVNEDVVEYIANLSNLDKIAYLKDNKFFFTPYYYGIYTNDNYTSSRIYDLDNPYMGKLKILAKNINVPPRVNIDKYTIVKTTTGYKIYIELTANTEFTNITASNIRMRLILPLMGNSSGIYFDATYDSINGYYIFDLTTDLNIDNDDGLTMINGTAGTTNKLVNLDTLGTFYVYTADGSVSDASNYLKTEIKNVGTTDYVVFTKESIEIKFGKRIDTYLWNKLYNTYTERKYMTHAIDVPLVYSKDVYERDPVTGNIFTYVTTGGTTNMVSNKIHSAGDPILDDSGAPMYKYRAGDVVLDINGKATINMLSGVSRYVDVLMLEYEYALATANAYKNYLKSSIVVLDKYINTDLANLNNRLIENTKLVYKTYKTVLPISITTNNNLNKINYNVKPKVVLYVEGKDVLTTDEIDSYRNNIGNILNVFLSASKIKLAELKQAILTNLGEPIIAVKVSSIVDDDPEIIEINDATTRLCLNKTLVLNKNNDTTVIYDIDLQIHYIG